MDEFDVNLLEARDRVIEACRKDPVEAWRRWKRTRSLGMMRPPRDWCLKLRADDRRITEAAAYVEPAGALGRCEEHEVRLTGADLRRLCAPVELVWPGVPLSEAARRLGRKPATLNRWLGIKVGNRRAVSPHPNPLPRGEGTRPKVRGTDGVERDLSRWEEYHVPGSPLCVRYEKATPHGHFGCDVPVVWAQGPLDPGAARGERPDPLFGSVWLKMYESLPDDYLLVARRAPTFGRWKGKTIFTGWTWVCPGRSNPSAAGWIGCGRDAQILYGPRPVWTVEHALGENVELEIRSPSGGVGGQGESELRLVGTWRPGFDDPLAGRRGFACAKCWRVQSMGKVPIQRHNTAVTYLSGGLLYGHEVARPAGLQRKRKCRPHTRKRKAAAQRGQALRLRKSA